MILPDSIPAPVPTPSPAPIPDPVPPAAARKETRSILLVVYNLVAMAALLGMAALMAFSTLVMMTRSLPGVEDLGSPLPNILLAFALGFCGLLFIPVTIHSFRRMNGKADLPAALPPLRVWTILSILAVWIVAALAAQLVGWISSSWILLPPLAALGVGLPIYLLFRAGTGGLGLGSRQRAWSVFGLGLTAGPALASAVELAAYLVALLVGSLLLALNPEWLAAFTQFAAQLENAASMEQILTAAAPYLTKPAVIALVLLAVSVFIPLAEELVKPVGIWLLRKRPPTPQEGFALGVISGAGFALLESLIAMASSDSDWGVAFLARVGGGVIHILNTGLMGWAIASFWKERRFGRLARTYGLVVFLHGLWNALTVLTVVGGLRVLTSPNQMDLLGSGMMMASILGLGALAVGGLIALVVFNLRMRSKILTTNGQRINE
ncbi:MAG: hypothetical protein FD146_1277 [Anaerolineaceae bacterium]|nr:MAG: hypothetical protein FD146_1277 [Anaerolineaceae bacterium]